MTNLLNLELKVKPACKGLIFRGRVNKYLQGTQYVEKYTMTLLKRKSCNGCENCASLLNDLHEFAYEGNVTMPTIKDGALYSLEVINVSIDYETGYADDWDLAFVEKEDD